MAELNTQWWNARNGPDYQADHSFIYHPTDHRLLVGDPNTHHADLFQALPPDGPQNGWIPGAVYDDKFETYTQHDNPGWEDVYTLFNTLHRRETGYDLDRSQDHGGWTFDSHQRYADQGIGGDAYPGETGEALVERQHVNDSYGQDSQFDDHPLVEYKFFFANGVLDVSGAHDLDGLRERNNVAPEHDGPTAVGNLIVQDGTAIWEVASNVSLGALVKALKKYTKDAGWDWGGVTDMKGEPLGDPEKLARKRYFLAVDAGQLKLYAQSPILLTGVSYGCVDVVGRVAAYKPFGEGVPFIREALREFADDYNFRLAEYPGGGAMTDQLRNHTPLGEDLELKNIDAEDPDTHELERFHKDKDRTPEGIFKCPTCGILIHRWHEYLLHRREEEPPGDPVEDGHFPTVEESLSEAPDFTEAHVSSSDWRVTESDFDPDDSGFGEGDPDRSDQRVTVTHLPSRQIFVGQPGAHHADLIDHHNIGPEGSGGFYEWTSDQAGSYDDLHYGWIQDGGYGHVGPRVEGVTEKLHAHGLLQQPDGSKVHNLGEESGWTFGSHTDHSTRSEIASKFLHGARRLASGWDPAAYYRELENAPETPVLPWIPGTPGKGFVNKKTGEIRQWSVEGGEENPANGVPHHTAVANSIGWDWSDVTGSHWLHSDGTVEFPYLDSEHSDEKTIRAVVQHVKKQGVAPRIVRSDETWDLTSRIAVKQPKDMFTEPVPFIYDIELDRIFVGHPGARHGEIEAPAGTKFTPGGIVEGEYQPGGKVVVESQSDTPYSVRHMVGLWYYQHPEFEVTGIMMTMPDGKQRKIAATDNIGAYVIGQAAQDPAVHAAWLALQGVGGEVYGVGGVVRDALLGKPSKDVDLLVTGLPAERVDKTLRKLPGRVDLTGKDFGVFRYNHDGHEVEIALPRTEKSTGERRVDFDVSVDHNLPIETDLERRDFTANAIAVNLRTGEMVDPYGGAQDIADRRLRTVHENSFPEDPTRLVRGLVAHSRHGLHPDPKTLRQMQAHAPALAKESPERIQAELDKLFSSDNPGAAIRLAHKTGMLKYLLPEVEAAWDFNQNNKHHNYPLGEHLIQVLDNISKLTKDPDLRLAALLHDIGKPGSAWTDPATGQSHFYLGPNGEGANHDELGSTLAGARLRELRHPTKRTERIEHLIKHHMYPDFSSSKGARKFLNRVGPEHAHDLMLLREADRAGKGTDEYQDSKTPVDQQRQLVDEALAAKVPTDRSALAINGNDLMGLGLQPGPAFSQILQALTDLVLEHPEYNDKHTLLNHVRHELMPSV